MRRTAALFLLACKGAAPSGPCAEDFPPLAEGGACGDYMLDGEAVCACPVATGALTCAAPPDAALLSVGRFTDEAADYGTWPPASAGVDDLAALRAFAAEVGPSAEIDAAGSGLAVDGSARGGWDDLDVAFSPEGDVLALGRRDVATLRSPANDVSLVDCADGWSVEGMIATSVWLVRWGAGDADERVLYFADGSLSRLAFDREPAPVETDGGETVTALVARRLDTLARKPDHDDGGANVSTADLDVVFRDGTDRYLAFLATDPGDGETLSRIYLSDLGACDLDRCESEGWDFCCDTALLAEYGPLTPSLTTVTAFTNPAMNGDGSLVSFHWDSIAVGDVDGTYSILYVTPNPWEDPDLLARCAEPEADGRARDCRALLGDDGSGRPTCPDIHDCSGADCAPCVAIGGDQAAGDTPDGRASRNLTSFFTLDGSDYLAVQRNTWGRDGSGGELMEWLDIYAVPDEGLAFDTDGFPIVVETATDAVEWTGWHPSALRRATP